MHRDDTVRMLKAIATAFDERDLDAIMAHIAKQAFGSPADQECLFDRGVLHSSCVRTRG